MMHVRCCSCIGQINDTYVECPAEMLPLLDLDGYCNLITDRDGVFGDCSAAQVAAAGDFTGTCRYDVCANHRDLALAKMAACRNMAAFARFCSDMGYEGIDWRSMADCRECWLLLCYDCDACYHVTIAVATRLVTTMAVVRYSCRFDVKVER